ncbi:alpha/beta-hydrolase [Salix suchowensis]|nr:alpha/beta-hydrolase [Salix suchowensis]
MEDSFAAPRSLSSFTPAAQTTGPIVDLGYARYRGAVNDTTSVTSYLGIRFAEPPVEDLRWRAPQPPKRLPGVQSATIVPPLCPQGFINISIPGGIPPPDLTNVSEDCLFLSAATFDGTNLVRESNDGVIVVTIQYRLGIFGFMAGKKLKENGDLNAGLRESHSIRMHTSKLAKYGDTVDQELALKWVQQHVCRVFDPHTQASQMTFTADRQVRWRLQASHHMGTISRCADATDPLTCLRASNTSILQAANDKACRSGFYGTSVVVPVVDGEFITQRPSEALRQRRVNGVRTRINH